MIRVVLSGNLRKFTGGETEVELEAGNVRQLFRALTERHPEIKPHLEEGWQWRSTARSTRTPGSSRSRPTPRSTSCPKSLAGRAHRRGPCPWNFWGALARYPGCGGLPLGRRTRGAVYASGPVPLRADCHTTFCAPGTPRL